MPVRTPGSMTQGVTPKWRSDISRRAAVTLGTTEEMAIPVICSMGATPCQPMNCRKSRASSSEVRSATVTMRQWSTRSPSFGSGTSAPSPAKRPIRVWVLPTSMASSTVQGFLFEVEGDVEDGRRVGQGADGDEVGAGGGVGRHGVERDPARHLDGDDPVGQGDGLGHLLGGHVVDEGEVGAGLLGLHQLVE